jgi:hypothetical protein
MLQEAHARDGNRAPVGSRSHFRLSTRGRAARVASHFPQKATAVHRTYRASMGWAASRMRVVSAGGALGRKSFREASSPGVREGVRVVRCALTARARPETGEPNHDTILTNWPRSQSLA